MRPRRAARILAATLVSLLLPGCERVEAPDTSPGVSWSLASHRASTLSSISYRIYSSVPDSTSERIRGRVAIGFDLSDASQPLVIDFKQPRASVTSVAVGAADTDFEVVNDHIVIPASALQAGRNEVDIEFVAGDGSLNRNREFLYTLFVPDRARFAFPCFDQPNLKARFDLTLEVPASWRAVANGRAVEHAVNGQRAVFRFAETKPISTYLFSFAAGDFQVIEGVRGDREMRMYHRETDSTKVARNTSAIFDLHAAALDWLEDYTGIPYPFDKFDFVLIPSFQYGGMEHPGAILYRASSLFLDESATQNAMLRRASLIAHETSHMWFGDLVTMDWFNDVWTKEVFANFMAAKIVNPSFPEVDHELRFLLAHYPTAYAVDRSEGANPIRQELDNLNEAGTLYGAIIYQKAPIVMRQLEKQMGAERLREGLRQYLQDYQYGNATWPDLIRILDSRTQSDLAAWSRVWVEESRRPTVTVAPSLNGEGNLISLALRQSDPAGAGRLWSQQLHVMLARPTDVLTLPVLLDTASVAITDVQGPAPDFILPNAMGIGYGLFELDAESLEYLLDNVNSLPEALTRGSVWLTLWDAVLEGRASPEEFVDVTSATLASEQDELLAQRLLAYLEACYWRYLTVTQRNRRAPEIESLLWGLIETAESVSLKAAYFNTFRSVALSDEALDRLEEVWSGDLTIEGLPLSERDYTRLAFELAVREVGSWESILDRQEARIENPDRSARFVFVRPALSADPAVRDRLFESLRDAANREHEPWVLEALRYLHHPLRAGEAEKYILPSLELLEEIQATGDIFFPKNWLDATLAGHNSVTAARVVRGYLEDHPDLPARLRGKVLQSADGLFKAASILAN